MLHDTRILVYLCVSIFVSGEIGTWPKKFSMYYIFSIVAVKDCQTKKAYIACISKETVRHI